MNRRFALPFLALVLLLSLAAPVGADRNSNQHNSAPRSCAGLNASNGADNAAPHTNDVRNNNGRNGTSLRQRHQRCLRLNDIQVIGTHNSYKQPVPAPVLGAIAGFSPELAASIDYSHSPLTEQLAAEEVRQIEIDVFADPEGGHLADRPVLDFLGLANPTPPELLEPGFKVLHINELDFNSSCLTLVNCLEEIQRWSSANRGHLPIMILVEVKTDPIPDPLGIGFTQALPVGPGELDALDAEIRSVFRKRQIIEPDDVRGRFDTLEQAVLADRWPTLARSRSKVMFSLINQGQIRNDYVADHPSLENRVMFTTSEPGQPDAAFFNIDDAVTDGDQIAELVSKGYVVRTRADIDTIEGRTGDTTRLAAALASGAQWISTDYPVPGQAFVDYSASIPDGEPARCNPLTTGPRCSNDHLEHIR